MIGDEPRPDGWRILGDSNREVPELSPPNGALLYEHVGTCLAALLGSPISHICFQLKLYSVASHTHGTLFPTCLISKDGTKCPEFHKALATVSSYKIIAV